MPAYFWRGSHSVSYGEGCVLVEADDLESARALAFAKLRAAGETENNLSEHLCPVHGAPDITLTTGSAELVEWQE